MLEQYIDKKSRNLSFIKICAAFMVIYSHSVPLTLGPSFSDFLSTYSNNQVSLGGFAVCVLFFSSGLYIMKQLKREKSIGSFFLKKIKRLFIPLATVVLFTVAILGTIFTQLNLPDYLTSKETYFYLINAFFIPIKSLPGVFENNVYPNVVNGALWTMPLEIISVIAVGIAYNLKLVTRKIINVFLTLMPIIYYFLYISSVMPIKQMGPFVYPLIAFFVGVAYYVNKENIKIDYKLFLLHVVLFAGLIYINQTLAACLFVLPYIIIYLSYGIPSIKTNIIEKIGRMNYEIYLVGFPIQQMIASFSITESPLIAFLVSLPLIIFIAFVINAIVTYINKKMNYGRKYEKNNHSFPTS